MSQTGSRRMGGRQARRQVRAMALPENLKPVRAGHESGRYLPLQENELDLTVSYTHLTLPTIYSV